MQGGCRADSADGKWFSVGGDWPCLIRINILQPISFSAGGWMDGSGGMDQVGWIRFVFHWLIIWSDSIQSSLGFIGILCHFTWQCSFRALSEHFQSTFRASSNIRPVRIRLSFLDGFDFRAFRAVSVQFHYNWSGRTEYFHFFRAILVPFRSSWR